MWMKDTNAQTQEHNKPKARQAWEGHVSTYCVSWASTYCVSWKADTTSKRKTTHALQENKAMHGCLLTPNEGGQKKEWNILKHWRKKINLLTQNSINSKKYSLRMRMRYRHFQIKGIHCWKVCTTRNFQEKSYILNRNGTSKDLDPQKGMKSIRNSKHLDKCKKLFYFLLFPQFL